MGVQVGSRGWGWGESKWGPVGDPDWKVHVLYGPSQKCGRKYHSLKDVRAHCYCASLARTPFIGHERATSFSSARTESKTRQNIELTTFALIWCANISVGCSVTPTFFRQITSFSDSFHYTKKQKNLCVGSFNYFSNTVQTGSNWYKDTGVRDFRSCGF